MKNKFSSTIALALILLLCFSLTGSLNVASASNPPPIHTNVLAGTYGGGIVENCEGVQGEPDPNYATMTATYTNDPYNTSIIVCQMNATSVGEIWVRCRNNRADVHWFGMMVYTVAGSVWNLVGTINITTSYFKWYDIQTVIESGYTPPFDDYPEGYAPDPFLYLALLVAATSPDYLPDAQVDAVASEPWSPQWPPTTPTLGGPSPSPPNYAGQIYQFSAMSTDPNGDTIRYTFDWGDQTTTTTPYYASGQTAYGYHAWGSPGEYAVTVTAQDSAGLIGISASNPITINILVAPAPPTTPTLNRPPEPNYINIPYQFSAVSTDPNGDYIIYTFNWGDGTQTVTYPTQSGVTRTATHTWNSPGLFAVTVTAKDYPTGLSSSPSAPITMGILPPPTHYLTIYVCGPDGISLARVDVDDVAYQFSSSITLEVSDGMHEIDAFPIAFGNTRYCRFAFMVFDNAYHGTPASINVDQDKTVYVAYWPI